MPKPLLKPHLAITKGTDSRLLVAPGAPSALGRLGVFLGTLSERQIN